MSTKLQNPVQVNLVRIQWSPNEPWEAHKNNVTVVKITNTKNGQISVRILENNKTIFNENLDDFQWLSDSSAPGVAALRYEDVKLVITYNVKEKEVTKFFNEIQKHLEGDSTPQPQVQPPSPPPEPPSPELDTDQAIDCLLKSIADDNSKKAEQAVKILARDRSNIGFNLVSQNTSKDTQSKSDAGASSGVLELKVQIECHLDRDPIIETIYVKSGTKLKALKALIEEETGISRRDQYWYAFGKYLINDDYEFGSDKPVVPPRPANAPKRQQKLPSDPIRSRDTIIMYIAKLAPCQ